MSKRDHEVTYYPNVETFLRSVHVLAAVLLIGPLVFVPFVARRAIGGRDPGGVRAPGPPQGI
jgi:hypothetical protein